MRVRPGAPTLAGAHRWSDEGAPPGGRTSARMTRRKRPRPGRGTLGWRALDEQHPHPDLALAYLPGPPVLGGVVPLPNPVHVGELDDHDPGGIPGALDGLGRGPATR